MSAERSQVTFVPVSGLHGDNVVEPSPSMAWYKGPTLLQAIEKLEPLKPPADSQPLRFTVQDAIDVPEVGTVAIGYAPLSPALTASPLPCYRSRPCGSNKTSRRERLFLQLGTVLHVLTASLLAVRLRAHCT